ncbi:HNH endonuclease signature motif containing protein [Nakamurella leprariae]|uniref:DUF222 domain-containing protein n=1 Tax=Nakamurella leprariae TaxID=2803911 RepID=A0A938YJI3_9ACTN|nr:HNH endonuclease signature motif containing protein [Nakamurella leprariae]MBM9469304.1 DUF222 domain-containing protein [Nakamurella leprariae]
MPLILDLESRPSVALLEELTAAPPRALASGDLVAAIRASERILSWLTGLQMRLLAEFARPGRAGDLSDMVADLTDSPFPTAVTGPHGIDVDLLAAMVADKAADLAAAEVGAALHLSPLTARRRVDRAVELVTELPETLAALELGQIDRARAAVIADTTNGLSPEHRSMVEQQVLPTATDRTPGRLRPIVDRAALAIDPELAERRRKTARIGREVTVTPAADGMAYLRAHLPAEAAATIMTLLDVLATGPDTPATTAQVGGPLVKDARTVGARRADALTDLCDALLTTGHVDLRGLLDAEPGPASDPKRHGRRPHLIITLPLSALAGLDALPGELAGHGAITAEVARALAASAASLTTVAIDPATGTATSVGDHVPIKYRPGQRLRDRVLIAQDTCRFPGCRQPSRRCDLDHATEFNHTDPTAGGPTSEQNLIPLCRRHHRLKTFTDWTPHPESADGTSGSVGLVTWTSPTGATYPSPAREFTLPGELTDPTLGHPHPMTGALDDCPF